MNVLVTGGGRGIGRAIAFAFAEPGVMIAIASRTRADLEDTALAIRPTGAKAIALTMDVTDESSVKHALEELSSVSPRIDVLVNNAGVGGGKPLADTDTASWRRV